MSTRWPGLLAATACACLALVSCDRKTEFFKSEPIGGERPKTEVFVLVDLSKTWHDPANSDNQRKNEALLKEVGQGIALSADELEPPLRVQYRVIGLNSLGREPACDATYMPTLVGSRSRDPHRVTRSAQLRQYLGEVCPAVLLGKPDEPNTEISAALASVAETPRAASTRRYIIIASDFREESRAHQPLPPRGLEGSKVLVLYRPVGEDDQIHAGEMQTRVEGWRASLEEFGATAVKAPDSGFNRADLVSFLNSQ